MERIALLVGGTVLAPSLLTLMQGCHAAPQLAAGGELSYDLLRIANAFADGILPRTSSPSASEAGFSEYLRFWSRDCLYPDQQREFASGLIELNSVARAQYGSDFADLDGAQSHAVLKSIETDAFAYRKAKEAQDKKDNDEIKQFGKAKKDGKRVSDKAPFWFWFKSTVLFAYFSSEVGARQALSYLHVPGKFVGNSPADKTTKIWAQYD